jgi:Zn finger protein HypA/HybF involved in hydrogenase expression
MGELECVCHLQESGTDPNCPRCLADIAGLSSQEEARELKACPFCGSDEIGVHPDERSVMLCDTCEAQGPRISFGEPLSAEERWNTRPTPDLGDVDELVERLISCAKKHQLTVEYGDHGAKMSAYNDLEAARADTLIALRAALDKKD